MSFWNMRIVLVLLGSATLILAVGGEAVFAQYYPSQSRTGSTASQPAIIQIHHHHYYQPTGPTPLIAQQTDPRYAAGPGYLGGPPSASMEPMPWERNWGELGFHAYLGQQGRYAGLIVSRVMPNSPASKLGLVVDDIILRVNDQVVNDLSNRELEILFLRLTSQTKQMVAMEVWNSHTRRTSTLKAEFENKEVKQYKDNEAKDTP